jgi:23S rRNA (adenine2503-C2)-methyltransferase
VLEAVRRICDPAPDGLGVSQRSVTVSSVGLVPVNTKWKVAEVSEAARE